jgi:hypothetical protein
MALREAGIVKARREGRNVYYQVKNPQVLELIQTVGVINNQETGAIRISGPQNLQGDCLCPKCEIENPEINGDEITRVENDKALTP